MELGLVCLSAICVLIIQKKISKAALLKVEVDMRLKERIPQNKRTC